jgi:hypothetical protein
MRYRRTPLSILGELRTELQGELEGLRERRPAINHEVQALIKDTEDRERALALVEAIEGQLAGESQGQPDLQGGGPWASTQVRGSVNLQTTSQRLREAVRLSWGLCPFCDSPCQRQPSSGSVPHHPTKSRSPSPRGPSPRPCGRTTCCRC